MGKNEACQGAAAVTAANHYQEAKARRADMRTALVADLERDGRDFAELLNDAPFDWAFASDETLGRHAKSMSGPFALALGKLEITRTVESDAIRALQGIWKDYNNGTPLGEREKKLAEWIDRILAPVIDERLGRAL